MTFEDFDNMMENTFETLREVRRTKGKEYANSDDRLDNFKRISKKKGVSPLVVAGIFLDKHLDALDYYIKNGKVESEAITGRIDDAILYLFLIKGLVIEIQDVDNLRFAMESVGAPFTATIGEQEQMQYACWRCGCLFLAGAGLQKCICDKCGNQVKEQRS